MCSSVNFKKHTCPSALFSLHVCTSSAIYPRATCAWSNISTANDRFNIKPLSVRNGSVKPTCLSAPVCWFSVSEPWGRHFLFFAGILTPLLALSGALGRGTRGTMLFTAQRALCAKSQHSMAGWTREQPAACSHKNTHLWSCTNTHTESHDHPRGLAAMFPALQSLHTVELGDVDRETNRKHTSVTPATITR